MNLPHNGTATSKAAAKRMAKQPTKVQQDNLAILEALYRWRETGLTREELTVQTAISQNSLRPRVVTLVERGYVTNLHAGTIMKRATVSGYMAEVLHITPKGAEVLRRRNRITPHPEQPLDLHIMAQKRSMEKA